MILVEDNYALIDFLVSSEPALWGLYFVVAFEVFSRTASDNSNGSNGQVGMHFPGARPPNGEDDSDRWKKVARKVVTLVLVTAGVALAAWWIISSGGDVCPPSPPAPPKVEPFVVADALAELIVRLEKPGSTAVAVVNSTLPGVNPSSPLAEVAAERLFDHLFDTTASQVEDLLGRSIAMANRVPTNNGPVTVAAFVEALRTGLPAGSKWLAWADTGELFSFLDGLSPGELKIVLQTYLEMSYMREENFVQWGLKAVVQQLKEFPETRPDPMALQRIFAGVYDQARFMASGNQIQVVQRGYLLELVRAGMVGDHQVQFGLAYEMFCPFGEVVAKRAWHLETGVKLTVPLTWHFLAFLCTRGNPRGWLKRFAPAAVAATILVGGTLLWLPVGSVCRAANTTAVIFSGDRFLLELAPRTDRPDPRVPPENFPVDREVLGQVSRVDPRRRPGV